ncbi:MAG TPA: APC family permease, partial [Candidatus Acidoferrales bacterium]|nr:APC family permease [Candidatus Acidoferrales bacterium]
HTHLALYLTVAMVLTVFLISASYSQIIELFPSGGGGYLVATKLLGPAFGVVSGGALVIDYMLTVATSVASGCDAVFSLFGPGWSAYKLPAELLAVAGLVALNLRGVKESVAALVPIFVAFVLTHVVLIGYGLLSHGTALGSMAVDTMRDTHSAIGELGMVGVMVLFLRAFSLGGGTYTGIEAVSNGVQILREPRVHTAKKTMLYMASSLSFTAGGILLCYLLADVQHVPGLTLNAALWQTLTRNWHIGGLQLSGGVVWLTLLSEGALLFVAAQTGFIDGPRTLSVMAVDNWVPKRFAHLSERLVTQNGIIIMGLATAALLVYTHGRVDMLVVMYSINVFITFTLSQLGMVRHWWEVRRTERHWRRRFLLATIGTLVTGTILAITSTVKFMEGGWVTLVVTGAFIAVCFVIRHHYQEVRNALRSLDEVLSDLPFHDRPATPELAPEGPTGIVLVEAYAGLGIHTVLSVQRMFPRHFKNLVFVSVGLVDSGRFKGAESVSALENKVRVDLERYVELGQRMGYYSEYRYTLGTDLIEELEHICLDLQREFRRSMVFAGQLVFQRETLFTRSLHHETAFSIQRRLQFAGVQVVILPIRVWEQKRSA